LPDDPRDLAYIDEVSWQAWLRENFAGPEFVNAQWKSRFATFDDASLAQVEMMLSNWRGDPIGDLGDGEDPNQKLAILNARGQQKGEPSWLFHPAALALAHYKWDTYRSLLAAWANVIKESDARPIFSGRLPDYAQLLSLPPSVSVSVPDLIPGVAEGDALTHNPQAISIARRGGRFQAIPTLLTRGSGAVAGEFVPQLMPRWIESALVSGASGVSFAFWPDILQSEPLRRAISRTLGKWKASDWEQAPVATAAVVLAPLAEGRTLQIGNTLPARRRGLYGFGDDLILNEPSDLVWALRWGTAFGGVDFLSVDDFSAGGEQLARYQTVLLPCALSVPMEASSGLQNFVRGGGVLVADLGAGAAQAGSNVSALPPGLAALFGVAPVMQTRHTAFNLSLQEGHDLLPTWSQNGRVGSLLTGGDVRGAAFAGLTGYPIPAGGATPIASGDQWLQPLGDGANGRPAARVIRSQLLANTQNGTAFWAPWPLWSSWKPGHRGYDSFHGDLFARNAALAAGNSGAGAPSLVPQPLGAPGPLWAPVVNTARGVAFFNPSPQLVPEDPPPAYTQSNAAVPPRPGTSASTSPAPRASTSAPPDDEPLQLGTLAASVQTAGVGDFLWSEALALFDPSAPFGVAAGRPAPIENADEYENRAQPVTLQVLVRAGQLKMARLLPVRAQNLAGSHLLAHVARYDEARISLRLWPNAEAPTVRNNDFSVALGESAPVRVSFYSGGANSASGYRIAPGSRHRVAITSTFVPPTVLAGTAAKNQRAKDGTAAKTLAPPKVEVRIATADERGRFSVEASGAAIAIEVSPAPN
jgi:hypothetical protein